jgi:hypothetical protein
MHSFHNLLVQELLEKKMQRLRYVNSHYIQHMF